MLTVHFAAFRPRRARPYRSSSRNAAMLQDAKLADGWNSVASEIRSHGVGMVCADGVEEASRGLRSAARNTVTKENDDEESRGDHRAVQAGCGPRLPRGPGRQRPLGVRGRRVWSRVGPGGLLPRFAVRHGLPPKLKLEIVVRDEDAIPTAYVIRDAARTGRIGDGKIMILAVEDAIRVRTGEHGLRAIYDPVVEPPVERRWAAVG